MKKVEIRSASSFSFEARAESTDLKVTGIAAPFNSDSVDMGYYIERYAQGCFTRTLKEQPDIFALRDHKTAFVVGRTTSKDLKFWEDDRGLNYEYIPPDTTIGQDLAKDIRAERITSCSIGFVVREEKWSVNPDKTYTRTLLDVDLWEMSFVAWPAYPETTAESNGMPNLIEARSAQSIFEKGLEMLKVPEKVVAEAMAAESRKRKLDLARVKSHL